MKIKGFHIEASTYCNARCPGCPRNVYGFNPKGFVKQQHLSPVSYRKIREKYQIEYVRINGGLGDPMMNPDIVEIVDIGNVHTTITTNGSLGRRNTFESLAKTANIEFSIDGLEDTNHLYRQDLSWKNIMERVDWFIGAGGYAIWKWVPFKHNHHQLEEAKKLSQQLGFKDFIIADQGRNDMPALDKEGNISHWIQPHDAPAIATMSDPKAAIADAVKHRQFFSEEGKRFDIWRCEHLAGEVYITAYADVTPCCYHGTVIGNRKIVPVEDFEMLRASWSTNNCDPTCANNCGRPLD